MKLYCHMTSGGAIYYSTSFIECDNGHKEGTLEGVVMRTDGKEIEIFAERLQEQGVRLIVH